MSQNKRHITDEAIQSAYQRNQSLVEEPTQQMGEGEFRLAQEIALDESKSYWEIPYSGEPHVGLHLREKWSCLVIIGKDHSVKASHKFDVGYENLPEFFREFESVSQKMGLKKYPINLCVSGAGSAYFLSESPKMSEALRERTFEVQLKSHASISQPGIGYCALPSHSSNNSATDLYLVGAISHGLRNRIIEGFGRLKHRVVGWDTDVLAFQRGVNAYWQREGGLGKTRIIVWMEWDHCNLIISGENGEFSASHIPIGIYSFLEHVSTVLGEVTISTKWLNPKELEIKNEDSLEVREVKVRAKEAIHSLFNPLAQQLKSEIFNICQSSNLSAPTHFSVVGQGAELFDITNMLSSELGLISVSLDSWLESDYAAAAGASLLHQHSTKVNLLPKGTAALFRGVVANAEKIKDQFLEKTNIKVPKFEFEAGANRKPMWIGVAVAFALFIGYPALKRINANRALSSAEQKLESLKGKKAELSEFMQRQKIFDKKSILKIEIPKKLVPVQTILREILGTLPRSIHLTRVEMAGRAFVVSGKANDRQIIEEYISNLPELSTISEAIPMSIQDKADGPVFQLKFALK